MKDLLQKSIELLRLHVLKNLETVRENENEIREILKDTSAGTRTSVLSGKYELSKKLLKENNDFINMQLTLINFINNHKRIFETAVNLDPIPPISPSLLSKEECFEKTINNLLEFEPGHPFFADDEFFSSLLAFYEKCENYEKCAFLINSRK